MRWRQSLKTSEMVLLFFRNIKISNPTEQYQKDGSKLNLSYYMDCILKFYHGYKTIKKRISPLLMVTFFVGIYSHRNHSEMFDDG